MLLKEDTMGEVLNFGEFDVIPTDGVSSAGTALILEVYKPIIPDGRVRFEAQPGDKVKIRKLGGDEEITTAQQLAQQASEYQNASPSAKDKLTDPGVRVIDPDDIKTGEIKKTKQQFPEWPGIEGVTTFDERDRVNRTGYQPPKQRRVNF
jgi:hypothetical protein